MCFSPQPATDDESCAHILALECVQSHEPQYLDWATRAMVGSDASVVNRWGDLFVLIVFRVVCLYQGGVNTLLSAPSRLSPSPRLPVSVVWLVKLTKPAATLHPLGQFQDR